MINFKRLLKGTKPMKRNLLFISLFALLAYSCSSTEEATVKPDSEKSVSDIATSNLNNADSSLVIAANFIAVDSLNDAKNNLDAADSFIATADNSLNSVPDSITTYNDLKSRALSLRQKSFNLRQKTEKNVVYSSNTAKRRLINPGEAWDFDKAPEITTDIRVSPVKFYTEKTPGLSIDEFRTVSKDSLIFDFRMYKEWMSSEKFIGKVISYNNPQNKIIITMNSSKSQVDSLKFWAAIYEASAYGQNQLPKSEQSFQQEKLQSVGATQSYLARYHFKSTEIATVFLQKGNDIIAVFVEYPNGTLSETETLIINQFLNTIKFK